jgi:hypothetical protein
MKVLEKSLPIWVSDVEDGAPTDRLDNNWYSPAGHLAELEVSRVARSGKYRLMTLGELSEPRGIVTGGAPEDEGHVGLIEGRNLRPNYVLPVFMKFSTEAMDMLVGDLLIGKDGEPGTVAPVTKALLDYCNAVTVGNHVYRIRLQKKYRPLAPFISAFLNSRIGQAILRKRIAGGTTPTIRKTDITEVPVLVPADERCPEKIADAVVETQKRILEAMDNLGPSKSIAGEVGIPEMNVRLPTNWAGGGAQRSSRIIS